MKQLLIFAFVFALVASVAPFANAQVEDIEMTPGVAPTQSAAPTNTAVPASGVPTITTVNGETPITSQTSAPTTAVSQTSPPNTSSSGGLINPLSAGTSLQSFLTSILSFVVKIGAVVVVLMLVYVGFLFATAGGDASQISTAREALLWTLVGALILLGAQGIATAIQATTTALSAGT